MESPRMSTRGKPATSCTGANAGFSAAFFLPGAFGFASCPTATTEKTARPRIIVIACLMYSSISLVGPLFARLAAELEPLAVEFLSERFIDALVSVSAKVVALGLKQVGGQALAAVSVVIRKSVRKFDDWQAHEGGRDDGLPPRGLGFGGGIGEVGMQQQVFEIGMLSEC